MRRGYDGAANGRLTASWLAPSTSADAEIWAAGHSLRDRSRDLVRNNPHAAKAVASLVANIVGEGIMPRPKTGDADEDRRVRAVFDAWAARTECDADAALDFYGLQTLVVREMIEGGEVLVRRRLRRLSDGYDVPVQLQVLEADFLDATRNGTSGGSNLAIQGIEFSTAGPNIGKPSAYWLYGQHPGGLLFAQRGSLISSPVPASEVLHVFEKQRTQVRGVPWGTPAMRSLRDLGDYEEAELYRKKLEACMVGVVTSDDPNEDGINPDPTATTLDYATTPGVYDALGNPIERFEPGMFAYARGGKDIRFNQPATIGGYNEYKVSQLRTIAAGFRLPYELLSGDLSQVNFSSGRMGLLEFRRFVRAVQWQLLVPMLLQPAWEWFCEAAYLAGRIANPTVPVEWSPPAFEWVNPVDDVAAATDAMRTGQRSWAEVIAESGRDPDVVYQEIKEFQDRCRRDGVVLDSDPSATSGRGVAQKDGGRNSPDGSGQRAETPLAQALARLDHDRRATAHRR